MTSPAVGTGIVAFIEARLDERERWVAEWAAGVRAGQMLLAEVAKDRAILALHRPGHGDLCRICDPLAFLPAVMAYPCQTVRLLAAIDADHPDFDPSWKPVAT